MDLRSVVTVLVFGLSAGPATAQLVTGKLVDRTTGEPLDGAFVVLVDSAGVKRGGILTNREGRYFLRAPAAGRYTIRVERIGYATSTSRPLTLSANETRVYDMAVTTQAIALEAIEVKAGQRCTVRPGSGARMAEVWDEARKALQLAVWTEQQRAVRYRMVDFERELDPATLRVLKETRTGASGYTDGSPYRSREPEDLARNGYIRTQGDSLVYFAPDAHVLLSDAFLDGHCFELRRHPERPDLIGLAFRPVHHWDQPDIEGVLWLDRSSSQLRYLEFRYTALPYPVTSSLIGGRVDFVRVSGGPWIVNSWRIRMPEVTRQHQVLGALGVNKETYQITGIHEVGGVVLDSNAGSREAGGGGAPGGSLAGVVYDSSGVVPVASVDVSLTGTGRSIRTTPNGRFEMHGLPDGRYGLRVAPRAWTLPWQPPEAGTADVRKDDTTFVRLQLPNMDAIVHSLCGQALPESTPGVVVGRVTDAAGRPVVGDTVVASWNRYETREGGGQIRAHWQASVGVTEADGWYRICGVPTGTLLRAVAVPPGAGMQQATKRLWMMEHVTPPTGLEALFKRGRILRVDLTDRSH